MGANCARRCGTGRTLVGVSQPPNEGSPQPSPEDIQVALERMAATWRSGKIQATFSPERIAEMTRALRIATSTERIAEVTRRMQESFSPERMAEMTRALRIPTSAERMAEVTRRMQEGFSPERMRGDRRGDREKPRRHRGRTNRSCCCRLAGGGRRGERGGAARARGRTEYRRMALLPARALPARHLACGPGVHHGKSQSCLRRRATRMCPTSFRRRPR